MNLVFVAALLSISLGQTCLSPTNGNRVSETISVEGTNREYQLFVPAGVSYPAGLVVAWHGISSSPSQIEDKMKMMPQAEEHKFIMVYPEAKNKGLLAAFNGAACCKEDSTFKDVEFMAAIKAKLVSDGCVDADRVFSMGYSNGGFLTHRIACEDNGLIKAGAIHSSTYGDYKGNLEQSPWRVGQCKGSTQAMIGFMGTKDAIVPFNGGGNPNPFARGKWDSWYGTMNVWSTLNGCGAATSVNYNEGGRTVNMTTWDGCEVESHIIEDLAHDWFSPATTRIVSFFQGHGL